MGKRHIDSAMESLSGEFDFSVHWKPYLLNPDTPEDGVPLELYLRRKFGDSSLQRFFAEDSPLQQAGKAAVYTNLRRFMFLIFPLISGDKFQSKQACRAHQESSHVVGCGREQRKTARAARGQIKKIKIFCVFLFVKNHCSVCSRRTFQKDRTLQKRVCCEVW